MSKAPGPWAGQTVRLSRHFFRSRLPAWVCLLAVPAAAAPAAGGDPSGKPAPAAVSPPGRGEQSARGTSYKNADSGTQLAGIDENAPCPPPAPKTGERKTWFGTWKDIKKNLKDTTGTEVSVYLDGHVGFVLSGAGEGRERDLFWWQVNVKQRLWKDARFVFRARGSSHSDHPPSGVVPLVGSNINLDWMAYETGWGFVCNAYVEQKFLDEKVMVAVGKMAMPGFFDTNAVSGWDFMSCSLVRNGVFPHRWHTIGAVVRYDPADWMYVQAGITDAQGRRSEMGTNTAFHGPDDTQSMFEAGFKPKFGGRQGTYRFDLWYDPRPMARWDGRGVERDDVGVGLNFDQMLTDTIGAFFRYGWNDERIKVFSHWWSLGGTWRGPIRRRPRDVVGFGVGQGIVSGDYKDARDASHTETLFEAYYKVCITEWCSLLFNVETVLDPGASSDNPTAVIPGVRLKLAF